MAKVKHDASGCWLWTGQKNDSGYAMIWKNGKAVRAHREMYKIFNGNLSDGLVVCHACDTPSCVNPEHLFAGTRNDNNLDSVKKLRNAYGRRNGLSALSKEQVLAIIKDTRRQVDIAADFGISQPHVSKIKSGVARSKINIE